jgi:hypothetical protein
MTLEMTWRLWIHCIITSGPWIVHERFFVELVTENIIHVLYDSYCDPPSSRRKGQITDEMLFGKGKK